MTRCTDVAGCARDPNCPDLACPGRPDPGPCSTCHDAGACAAPIACHQPERATQFRPTYELEGPHSRRRALLLRALDFLITVIALAAFTALVSAGLHALGLLD